ncbi:MAG: hypothetical protein GW809_04050 [Bacteroidetes bacterium]|nr:hypothetical protein [Bacteroidota bacterium]
MQNYEDSLSRSPSVTISAYTKLNARAMVTIHEYDAFGNEIKWSNVGESSRYARTVYKYDKNMNWIEKKMFLANGRIKLYKREFDYWE